MLAANLLFSPSAPVKASENPIIPLLKASFIFSSLSAVSFANLTESAASFIFFSLSFSSASFCAKINSFLAISKAWFLSSIIPLSWISNSLSLSILSSSAFILAIANLTALSSSIESNSSCLSTLSISNCKASLFNALAFMICSTTIPSFSLLKASISLSFSASLSSNSVDAPRAFMLFLMFKSSALASAIPSFNLLLSISDILALLADLSSKLLLSSSLILLSFSICASALSFWTSWSLLTLISLCSSNSILIKVSAICSPFLMASSSMSLPSSETFFTTLAAITATSAMFSANLTNACAFSFIFSFDFSIFLAIFSESSSSPVKSAQALRTLKIAFWKLLNIIKTAFKGGAIVCSYQNFINFWKVSTKDITPSSPSPKLPIKSLKAFVKGCTNPCT